METKMSLCRHRRKRSTWRKTNQTPAAPPQSPRDPHQHPATEPTARGAPRRRRGGARDPPACGAPRPGTCVRFWGAGDRAGRECP